MNTYIFDVPTQLNGEQLKQELNAEQVYIDADKLVIDSDLTKSEIQQVLSVHIPAPVIDKAAARQAILDRLGLTADEAAILLG